MSGNSTPALDSRTLADALRPGGDMARRYEALWQAVWQQAHVPARVLELCRLRLAQLHGAAREFDSPQIEGLLAELRNERFSAGERAALEFAEVYAQDPQAITDDIAGAVKREFGEAGLVALIEALGVIDGRIRLAMMLGALLPGEAARG